MIAGDLTRTHVGKRIRFTTVTRRGRATQHEFLLGHVYRENNWVHMTAAGEDLWGGVAVTADQVIEVMPR